MPTTRLLAAATLLCVASTAIASTPVADVATDIGQIRVERMAEGLEEPWGLAFLPDGRFLVTERDGRLSLFSADGSEVLARFDAFPGLVAEGQGGLLDVLVPRDFPQSRQVFVSYAKEQGGRSSGTVLAAIEMSPEASTFGDIRVLFEMAPGSSGGRHFGSRIVEAGDGTLFMTIGERGAEQPAQDPTRHEGSVVHLDRTGAPASTPLFGPEGLPDLYSKGHRNPQGAALDAEGRLWVVEHGARGGDELNLVLPGRNYGWPVITYGRDYGGDKIGVGTEAPGLEQPIHYWDPSIAPSGLMIYTGGMFPEWQGDVFIGSLKFDYIARLDPDAGYEEDRIETPQTGRVRDVRQAPDGSIWFLSVTDGAAYRLSRPQS
jgi:glucose/arabinose dehydrogenase